MNFTQFARELKAWLGLQFSATFEGCRNKINFSMKCGNCKVSWPVLLMGTFIA